MPTGTTATGPVISGTIITSVMNASSAFIENRTIVTKTIVRPWTANWTRPSCSSCWSASMSLVIRVIVTPAFSAVK